MYIQYEVYKIIDKKSKRRNSTDFTILSTQLFNVFSWKL